jgi:F-type H+-transporting ATPase subunit c
MEGELAHRRWLGCNRFRRCRTGVGHVANFLAWALCVTHRLLPVRLLLFIGIAFAEALGIFSFLVALLLMFAV